MKNLEKSFVRNDTQIRVFARGYFFFQEILAEELKVHGSQKGDLKNKYFGGYPSGSNQENN